uniref:DinB family protein n=1 Tax=Eiseniibacteriota bacterium TaxID=2212470 RepID=A0A832I3L7_UNCEI
MNKTAMMEMWEQVRLAAGIALRAVEALPADRLDAHPIRDMRTPRELVVHMFATIRAFAEGALSGEIKAGHDAVPAGVTTRDELVAWCRATWDAANRAVTATTDAHATAMVKTPWGVTFPGIACIGAAHTELLHHRGQLYAYLRQLGVEPPMLWDIANSAPEFRPRQAAQA